MPEAKHTKGPWRLDRSMRDCIFVKGGYAGVNERTIVIVSLTETEYENRDRYGVREQVSRTKPVKSAEADARLIAAAPDLLAALKEAVNRNIIVEGSDWWRQVYDAIDKAEGGQS